MLVYTQLHYDADLLPIKLISCITSHYLVKIWIFDVLVW